jgi:tetratricopeptide (TPR) repeat protein
MKASTELFKLIKSFTKSEKRFFKMFSELQAGEKNYIRLFDFIEKQKEYDEEEVKEHFKNELFIQHLPSEKNFLTKTLLKSLRQFHSDSSSTGRLTQDIRNVQLLYQKGLFVSCKKALKRAKQTAIECEHLHHLHEVLSWEKRLIDLDIEQGDFNSNLEIVLQEEALVLNQLHNLAEYQILYTKINTIFRTGGFVRDQNEKEIVEKIADNYLIKGKNTAISVNATSICFYIKGLCAATSRDYENAFVFFKKVKDVLDRNPMVRAELATRYVQTIHHLIHCCYDTHNESEANILLEQLVNLKNNKDFAHQETLFLMENIENQLHWGMMFRKGNFEEVLAIMSENQKIESSFYLEKSKEIKLVEMYHCAYSNFALGKYKVALRFVNELLNDVDQRLRNDIFSYARILNILTHLELGNFDHVNYVTKSNLKRLQEATMYPLERFANDHILSITEAITTSQKSTALDRISEEIIKFKEEVNDPYLFNSLDFPACFEAFKKDQTLVEYYAKKS